MKELSDWQLSRVRNALRAYHRYERLSALRNKLHHEKQVAKAKERPDHCPRVRLEQREKDDFYFTWKDVRDAIALYTGHEIGGAGKNGPKYGTERLRSFVEGEMKKGVRRLTVPKPDAMEAIVAFVTHEELNLLSIDELQDYVPGFRATMHLSEFLREGCSLPTDVSLPALAGHFMSRYPYKDGWRIRSLFLQRPSDDGIFQVVETHDHYVTESREEALKWWNENNSEKRTSRFQYGGWAIVTPEDSLMLFLKHKSDGRNHRYLCLDDIGLWQKKVITEHSGEEPSKNMIIFMLEHDFAYDFSGVENIGDVMNTIKKYLFVFEKMPGHVA